MNIGEFREYAWHCVMEKMPFMMVKDFCNRKRVSPALSIFLWRWLLPVLMLMVKERFIGVCPLKRLWRRRESVRI